LATKRSKKNKSILAHPIDTLVNWYDDIQILPANLKKNAKAEVDRTLRNIKQLKNELKTAMKLSRKKWSSSLIARRKKVSVMNQIKRISKRLTQAQTHLKAAKIKQTYLKALEKTISGFTKLFGKKQTKKRTLKKTKAVHPAYSLTRRTRHKARMIRHARPHKRHIRRQMRSVKKSKRRI
jgi:hypothetical protein